jgi:hypothetical protein
MNKLSYERQKRVVLTSYLMEKGHRNPSWLAHFWGVSTNTAKLYMKEAKFVKLNENDKEKIMKIKEKENCTLPEAVATYYRKSISCFIATAAFGTSLAKEIDSLRNWRDRFSKHNLGKFFVNIYYVTGRPLAFLVSKNAVVKYTVRIFIRVVLKVLK